MELGERLAEMVQLEEMLTSICYTVANPYGLNEDETKTLIANVADGYRKGIQDMMQDIFLTHMTEEEIMTYVDMHAKVIPASHDLADALCSIVEGEVFKIKGIKDLVS